MMGVRIFYFLGARAPHGPFLHSFLLVGHA